MLARKSRCSQGLLCFISRLSPRDAQDKGSLVPSGSRCCNAIAIIPTHVDALTWIQEIMLDPLPTRQITHLLKDWILCSNSQCAFVDLELFPDSLQQWRIKQTKLWVWFHCKVRGHTKSKDNVCLSIWMGILCRTAAHIVFLQNHNESLIPHL